MTKLISTYDTRTYDTKWYQYHQLDLHHNTLTMLSFVPLLLFNSWRIITILAFQFMPIKASLFR